MCVKAAVSLKYSCICVCVTFYNNACQGDMRAKCSLYRRLMCRQATLWTSVHAFNPWERGPQSSRGSEWKYGRSSCVRLLGSAQRWLGMGSWLPSDRHVLLTSEKQIISFFFLAYWVFVFLIYDMIAEQTSRPFLNIIMACLLYKAQLFWLNFKRSYFSP